MLVRFVIVRFCKVFGSILGWIKMVGERRRGSEFRRGWGYSFLGLIRFCFCIGR